jgi:tetratricopeptide (TPR) repeat protein
LKRSKRAAIVISGMHRSGTSALARVVNLAGWTMPGTLMRPAEANQSGHWESLPIVFINNRILRALGRVWADPKPLPEGWMDHPKVKKIIAEAPQVIASEFENADNIVVKDPRLSRLLPLWLSVFEELGYDPHCLIACRNPIEVCQSLNTRDSMKQNHAMLLWETYMLEAELHSRSMPRALVHYEALLENWRDTLADALSFETLGFDGAGPEASNQIDAFLSPHHRNAIHSTDSLFEAGDIKPRIKKFYTLLQGGLPSDSVEILDKHHVRWAVEWVNRSPGPGPSNFWDSLPVSFVTQSRELAKRGDKTEAIAAAQRAITIDPSIARHHHYLASLLAGYEMFDEAEQAEREAITRYGGDPQYHEGLARILLAQGRLPDAIEAMSTAINLEPGSAKYHNFIGSLQAQAERLADAECSYRRATELDDSEPRYFRSLSDILRRLDRLQDAIEPAATAADLAEDKTPFLLNLAKILNNAGEFDRAEQVQRELIATDPSDPQYRDGLAKTLLAQGRLPDAIDAMQEVINLEPDKAEYHYYMGDLLTQAERLADAEHSYCRAAELDGTEPRYFRSHSEILRRLGRPQDAVEPAVTAAALAEDKAPYLLNLAKILNSAGEFQRAEKAFADALETGGDQSVFIEPYRDLLVRLGRPREAVELTLRLAEVEPESAKVRSDLAEHFVELGQAQSAVQAQAAAAELSAKSLGVSAFGRSPEALASLLSDLAKHPPDDAAKIEEIKVLMSWLRASELVTAYEQTDETQDTINDASPWPIGAAAPVRNTPKIARYGSLSGKLARAKRALLTPKAQAMPQFGERPRMSVMVPVYNIKNRAWFRECLQSILMQQQAALSTEIVIVDDASDNAFAREIAAEFAPRIGYFRNPENLGIVENHNHCIRMARGELVHILHQDDRLQPDFYTKVAQPLLSDDSLVASFSRARIVDDQGEYRNDQSLLQTEAGIAEGFSAKMALRQRVLFPTMIVRRSAYERVGGFSRSLIFAFDLEMWSRLSSIGPVWFEPEPLADYRTHQWSVTNSIANRDRLVDGMQAARLNLDHIEQPLKAPTLAATMYRLLLREWGGIDIADLGNTDSSDKAVLLEFLLGALSPALDAEISAPPEQTNK